MLFVPQKIELVIPPGEFRSTQYLTLNYVYEPIWYNYKNIDVGEKVIGIARNYIDYERVAFEIIPVTAIFIVIFMLLLLKRKIP